MISLHAKTSPRRPSSRAPWIACRHRTIRVTAECRHRFRFRSLRARDQRSQEPAEAGGGARAGCRAACQRCRHGPRRRRGEGPRHRDGARGPSQAKASLAAAIPQVAPAADTAELDRLKELVAKQEASLEEKTKALGGQGGRGRSQGGPACRARCAHHVSQ